jgi:3-isopropylmalate dehydrogenase
MRILVLEGDGIGAEIAGATVGALEVLDRELRLGLEFQRADIGFAALETTGTTFPDAIESAARAAAGTLLGPVSHADYPSREAGGLNPSGELRRRLDLYANERPSRTRPGIAAAAKRMDLVVMRENTEGFYADRNMHLGLGEFMPTPDVALAVRKITRQGSRRIVEAAFALARMRRRHVTAVHKSNVLRISDGLFMEEFARAAAGHADCTVDDHHIDAACAQLIRTPEAFDVIVTTNMYGDIVSNVASELAGSLGLAASLNFGDQHAVAQAAHGSAPDIAGRGIGNPTGLMLSAAMLLAWLGRRHGRDDLREAGQRLNDAVESALAAGIRTPDLGGGLSTGAFAAAVIDRLFNRLVDRLSARR